MKLNTKVQWTRLGPIRMPYYRLWSYTPREWAGWMLLWAGFAAFGCLTARHTLPRVILGIAAVLFFLYGMRLFMRTPLRRPYSLERAEQGEETGPGTKHAEALESSPEVEDSRVFGSRPVTDPNRHTTLPPVSPGERSVGLVFVLALWAIPLAGLVPFLVRNPRALFSPTILLPIALVVILAVRYLSRRVGR